MGKRLYIILTIISVLFMSCSKKGIIPKDVMEDIYYDMYLTDSYIRYQVIPVNPPDSTLIYEPIFNKYGYTTSDYLTSNRYYLRDPENYRKILVEVKKRLEEKDAYLTKLIAYTKQLDTFTRHIDSIAILGAPDLKANAPERALNFILYTRYHIKEKPEAPGLVICRTATAKETDIKADSAIIARLTEEFIKADSIMKEDMVRDIIIKDTSAEENLRVQYLTERFRQEDSVMISQLMDKEDRSERMKVIRDSVLNMFPDNLFIMFGDPLDAGYDCGYFVKGMTVEKQIRENKKNSLRAESIRKEEETRKWMMQKIKGNEENKRDRTKEKSDRREKNKLQPALYNIITPD